MQMHEKIKYLRERNGLTLEEVGKQVGVGKSTVRKWETGQIANMRRDKIAALANALHTSPAYLMGWDDDSGEAVSIPAGFEPNPELSPVPLIGNIACGTPITAEENIESQIAVPALWHATFSLHCKGDSMSPVIHDGDLVSIRQQPTVENGQIAAVLIDNEATLKRVYVSDDRMILQPVNPDFQPIVLVGDEIDKVKIEGLAVGLCRNL